MVIASETFRRETSLALAIPAPPAINLRGGNWPNPEADCHRSTRDHLDSDAGIAESWTLSWAKTGVRVRQRALEDLKKWKKSLHLMLSRVSGASS
jgi:hypothetical protein